MMKFFDDQMLCAHNKLDQNKNIKDKQDIKMLLT
jgi:hypothetical protein